MSLLNRPVYLARLTTVIEKFFGLEPADTTSLCVTEPTDIAGVHRTNPAPPVF
jgi:hypothetical protein